MEKIGNQDRKKIILCLRWTVIIVTSYLILFGKGRITNLDLGHLFVLLYICSNFILMFLPRRFFSNPRLFYLLVLFDTGILSFGMYLSERMTTMFKGYELGANYYITKPFTKAQLLHGIEMVLGKDPDGIGEIDLSRQYDQDHPEWDQKNG